MVNAHFLCWPKMGLCVTIIVIFPNFLATIIFQSVYLHIHTHTHSQFKSERVRTCRAENKCIRVKLCVLLLIWNNLSFGFCWSSLMTFCASVVSGGKHMRKAKMNGNVKLNFKNKFDMVWKRHWSTIANTLGAGIRKLRRNAKDKYGRLG